MEEKTQALNELFDIYADASFDYTMPVFVHHGFLMKLQHICDDFENQMSMMDTMESESESYSRAEEAFMNLKEFIKYKQQEL